jgi:hypothetical protein
VAVLRIPPGVSETTSYGAWGCVAQSGILHEEELSRRVVDTEEALVYAALSWPAERRWVELKRSERCRGVKLVDGCAIEGAGAKEAVA